MKRVLLLGATGSVGSTFLKIYPTLSEKIKLVGIVANSNLDAYSIARKFNVPCLLMGGKGTDEFHSFIDLTKPDIALNGVSGSSGLVYTDILIERKIDIALANKESIVLGGKYILSKAKANGVSIIPVDSEHSALDALIKAHGKSVRKLILTCSGGPFLHRDDLGDITLSDAIKHPTWNMGKEISVDSATLSNKGLEVIEASYLFSFKGKDIDVVIHPESIVHSMVMLENGGIYMEASKPDMAFPIAKALIGNSGTERIAKSPEIPLSLNFLPWDRKKWKMLTLSYQALEMGASYPIAYISANEIARNMFISGKIGFLDIQNLVEKVLDNDFSSKPSTLDEILFQKNRALSFVQETLDKSCWVS